MGRPYKIKIRHYERHKKNHWNLENILTKSYEDAISDVLAILNHYIGVGVYTANLIPIIDRIKSLNTTDPKELKPDITKDPKISREVLDELEYIQRLSQ